MLLSLVIGVALLLFVGDADVAAAADAVVACNRHSRCGNRTAAVYEELSA